MDYTGSLGFRGLHPLAAFVFFACWIVMLTLGFHLIISAAALALSLILLWALGLGSSLRRNAVWFVLTLALMTLINPLINHRGRHILFYFMDQPITLEAVVYGLHSAVMIVGTLCAFMALIEVVHPQRFLYLFSGLSPKMALLSMMALRFIPLLRRRLHEIALVQRTRNGQARSLAGRAKMLMQELEILASWSLEEAVQTADSMAARGYGTRRRSTYHPYRLTWRDGAFIAVCAAVFLLCVTMWLYGWGRMDRSGNLGWTWQDSMVLACITFYAAVPIGLEGRERWWWCKHNLN